MSERRKYTKEDEKLGAWLSAELSNKSICEEFRNDVINWFNQFEGRFKLSERGYMLCVVCEKREAITGYDCLFCKECNEKETSKAHKEE